MMLVVTYDVDTSDSAGQKRLRKVAKICERHGMRVQSSVFEVLVDAAQLVVLKQELGKLSIWSRILSAFIDSAIHTRTGSKAWDASPSWKQEVP